MIRLEIERRVMSELPPRRRLIALPTATNAIGVLFRRSQGAHDHGFVYRHDTATAINKGLIGLVLFVADLWHVQELDQQIGLVELCLARKVEGFVDTHAWNRFEQGNEELLNADVVMRAAAVILRPIEPKNIDIATEFRALKGARQLQNLGLGHRLARANHQRRTRGNRFRHQRRTRGNNS